MLTFSSPPWFLALPLPYLLWLVATRRHYISNTLFAGTTKMQATVMHSQADLLAGLGEETRANPRVPWLWLTGCMLLLTAMARPQWLDFNVPGAHRGHDIMLAIDVSGSMRALDFAVDDTPVSRLDMLKQVTKQFLDKRTSDRIGLIMFADDAMTFMPLTSDITMVRGLVDEIRNGIAGEKTALGDTIALAIERLSSPDNNNAPRILIMLTDGANTAGSISPEAATLLAKRQGIRIYTIGIGTDNTVAFPRGPVLDPVYTELPLDEDMLRTIAGQTGGRYFHAANTAELQKIYTDIDQLETIEIKDPHLADRRDWYWLPLLAGLGLLLLSERRQLQGAHAGVLP